MDPAIIITLVNAGIAALEAMAAKGEVTAEKVAEIKARAVVSEAKWDAAVDAAKARLADDGN